MTNRILLVGLALILMATMASALLADEAATPTDDVATITGGVDPGPRPIDAGWPLDWRGSKILYNQVSEDRVIDTADTGVDTWIYDLKKGTKYRVAKNAINGVFSPDVKRIAFWRPWKNSTTGQWMFSMYILNIENGTQSVRVNAYTYDATMSKLCWGGDNKIYFQLNKPDYLTTLGWYDVVQHKTFNHPYWDWAMNYADPYLSSDGKLTCSMEYAGVYQFDNFFGEWMWSDPVVGHLNAMSQTRYARPWARGWIFSDGWATYEWDGVMGDRLFLGGFPVLSPDQTRCAVSFPDDGINKWAIKPIPPKRTN